MENKRIAFHTLSTRDLTLTASLAAFFIVTTFIPVDAFIGGAGIITFEIVTVPLIAALLRPTPATVAVGVGSVGMAVFRTGTVPVFGLLALLVPVIAVVLGSVAFHSEYGLVLPWIYVLFGAAYYLYFSQGGTLFWLAPYIIVAIALPLAIRARGNLSVLILCFYTAMAWQVTLNILSINAGLTDGFWTFVTPFMFFERTVATLVSATLIVALKNRLDTRLGLSQELVRG